MLEPGEIEQLQAEVKLRLCIEALGGLDFALWQIEYLLWDMEQIYDAEGDA